MPMTRVDEYINILKPLLSNYVIKGNDKEFLQYLKENSNLPGRRANLELAEAFSNLILKQEDENLEKVKLLIKKLLSFSIQKAPTNDKKEFYAFCGTWSLGSFGISEDYSDFSYSNLKLMAKDKRWRIREAVAKAIKILVQYDRDRLVLNLKSWFKEENNWLIMRAIVAGIAESLVVPSIMIDTHFVNECLNFHKLIIQIIQSSNDRRSDDFQTLKKGLGYTLSVIVQASPEDGFIYLKELSKSNDKDILWILNNNIKKNRLIKNYPKQVKELKNLLK
ncbi:MAG: hypothetical protein ACFE8N_06945 [Promethearchaeota archaeon]